MCVPSFSLLRIDLYYFILFYFLFIVGVFWAKNSGVINFFKNWRESIYLFIFILKTRKLDTIDKITRVEKENNLGTRGINAEGEGNYKKTKIIDNLVS